MVTGAEDSRDDPSNPQLETFREYKNIFNKLWEQGYDVIFLDFEEGATYIQKNAEVLKALLRKVNSLKVGKLPNTVVGPSMGGQVARIALAEMERDKEDHCTSLYVSFDSPHQGANIPLGLQSMAWAASETGLNCGLWRRLNFPAARQLLVEHLSTDVKNGRVLLSKKVIGSPPTIVSSKPSNLIKESSTVFSIGSNINMPSDNGQFRTKYVELLNSVGYPKLTNNVAIADGNISGLGQGFSGGDALLKSHVKFSGFLGWALVNVPKLSIGQAVANELNINAQVAQLEFLSQPASSWGLTALIPNDLHRGVDLHINAVPGSATKVYNHHSCPNLLGDFSHLNLTKENGNVLFQAAIPTDLDKLLGNEVPCEYTIISAKINPSAVGSFLNFDSAPGGNRNDISTVKQLIENFGKTSNTTAVTETFNQNQSQCFIPSFSAFDVQLPLNNTNLSTLDIAKKLEQNPNLTPFEQRFGKEDLEQSLRHVEVDEELKAWVLARLTDYAPDLGLSASLPTLANQSTYNYGLWRKRIPSLAINSGGKLYINNRHKTAFLNEDLAIKPIFETYIAGCGALVSVNNGGQMIIGSDNGTQQGVVHVAGSSVLEINTGGRLTLQKASQIIIEDGGKMFINSGTTTLVNGSKIIIKKGSQLTIKAGASININDNSQIIVEVGGKLILEKGVGNQLAFNGVGSGTSVLVRGELIVNTPIKMNGTAYFDFASGNKVTLLNTFEFTGQNKAQKMINLQENATLSLQNQSIVVRNGNITYGNYSKIILPASKIADLMDIGFNTDVTSIATTGLTNIGGVSPQILRIRDCEFNYLSKCIDLQHDEGQIQNSPIVFNITRSSFYQYKLFGVLLSNAHNLQAFSSSFSSEAITNVTSGSVCESCVLVTESKAPPAIIAMSIPSGIVGLKDCEIKGFGVEKFKERYIAAIEKGVNKGDALCFKAGNLYKLLNNEDGAEPCDFMDDFSYLVYLDDVPNFHLKGTNIHDAYVGILSRGNSNIIMSQGALLWNNGMGASMSGQTIEGNPTAALFFMDCSYMLDNIIGVSGRDVVLAIDEFVNSNSKNLNTFSNFMQDKISGLYFDIYHTFKPKSKLPIFQYQSQTQIPATNNTWKTGSPIFWNISLPSNLMEYDILQGFNATNAWVPAYELVVDPNAPSDQSVDCRIISNDDDPREAPPTKQGAVSTIIGTSGGLGTLWSGISAMLNENVEEMKAAFTPLAKVSDYERNNTENIYTQLYVDIAKALVYAPSDDVPIEVDGRSAKVNTTSKSSVLVYPNPAHQWLTVELPTQNHRLQLADGLGRSVYNETVNGTTRINVGQYPSGVYHVIVTDANGIQTRSKVVVQHD